MVLFHRTPGPRPLPPEVRQALVSRFYVAQDRVKQLLCIEREGRYAGRPVRYVRVFDPSLVCGESATIRQFEDAVGRCLQFEGRLEKQRPPRLKDLRVSLLSAPRSIPQPALATPAPPPDSLPGYQQGFAPD